MISDLLDPSPFVIGPSDSLLSAMAKIDGNMSKIVFVCQSDQTLIGSLSDGDIRRHLLRGGSTDNDVSRAFNPNPHFASQDSLDADVSRILSDKRLTVIPVVDQNRRIAGVVNTLNKPLYPIYRPHLYGREMEYLIDCLDSNWISSQGAYVKRFEQQFEELLGGGYQALAVSNGTVALFLALTALGIGPGDMVLVPTLTFAATANAVIHTGAEPVFVDVDEATWCLKSSSLTTAFKLIRDQRIRAIISVDLYGNSCESDLLRTIADHYGILFIEDAAEALGTTYLGKHIGGFSDAVTFSFFGNKTVTTGEGGMVAFRNHDIAEKARILRDHGMDPQRSYWHSTVGYNLRLTNLQAALGVAQIERLAEIIDTKRMIHEVYQEHLPPFLAFQEETPGTRSSYWLNSLLLPVGSDRSAVVRACAEHGAEIRTGFYPLHHMPPYAGYQKLPCPVSDQLHLRMISLPSSSSLSELDAQRISSIIASILQAD